MPCITILCRTRARAQFILSSQQTQCFVSLPVIQFRPCLCPLRRHTDPFSRRFGDERKTASCIAAQVIARSFAPCIGSGFAVCGKKGLLQFDGCSRPLIAS
jgi:hypothetical protein